MATLKRFKVSVWEACKKEHQEFWHVCIQHGLVRTVQGMSKNVKGSIFWNAQGQAFDEYLDRIPSEDISLVEPNSNENGC